MANAAFLAALERDAAIFTGDFGSTVVNGSTTAHGNLSVRDVFEDNGGMMVQRRRRYLRMAAGVGGTIEVNTQLTIDGVVYRVDAIEPGAADGAFVDYRLAGGAA